MKHPDELKGALFNWDSCMAPGHLSRQFMGQFWDRDWDWSGRGTEPETNCLGFWDFGTNLGFELGRIMTYWLLLTILIFLFTCYSILIKYLIFIYNYY